METTEREFRELSSEEEEKSVLDSLIDLLPFEAHVPGYRFMGPGTKLAERLARGEVGINPLDEACREHDIAYTDKKINRQQADRILAERAFSRMLAGDTPSDERSLALLTACCMVSKITFEKLFSRIKRAIKCKDKKRKNSGTNKKINDKKASIGKKEKNKKKVQRVQNE